MLGVMSETYLHQAWRKGMGVEPTGSRVTASPRFEVWTSHRGMPPFPYAWHHHKLIAAEKLRVTQ